MSKPFHYWTRFTLALTLSATLIVSPVWAGRIFKHRGMARATDCCVVVPTNCCEIPVVQSECCSEVVQPTGPCGCDAVEINEAPSTSQPAPVPQEHAAPATPEVAPPPAHETPAPTEPAPTPPTVIESQPENEIPKSPFSEPAPTPAPSLEQPAPTPDPLEQPTPAAPQEVPAPQPAPNEEPLFPAEPAPAPNTQTPAEPAPAPAENDLFSTPAEQPKVPATESDDLFGTPAPAPAPTTPEPSKVPATDDLFGTPEPAPQPAAPATEGTDIFGTPEPTPAPTEPATPPANEPALDNLFGDPAPAEKAPAPAADPAGSLFDAPADPKKEEGTKVDNLFDSSSTDNSKDSNQAADAGTSGVDDLFGTPVSTPDQTPATNSDATPAAPASKDDLELDKLFDSSDLRSSKSGFSGAEVRVWIDNTGNFTTTGRLVTIFANEIRLLKDNGKTTTVPIRRLSEADLDYVKKVYVALNNDSSKAKEFFVQHENGMQGQNGMTR